MIGTTSNTAARRLLGRVAGDNSRRRICLALTAMGMVGLTAAASLAADPPSWDLLDENYGSGAGEVSYNANYTYMWGSSAPTETLSPGKAALTINQGAPIYYPSRATLPGLPLGGADVTSEWKLRTPINASVLIYYSEVSNATSAWDHIIMLNRQFSGTSPTLGSVADYNRRDPNLNQAPAGFDGTASHTFRLVRSLGADSLYIDNVLAISPVLNGAGARQDGFGLSWGFYTDFADPSYDLEMNYFKLASGAYFPTPPPPPQWAANVSGNWNSSGNWTGTTGAPNAVDAIALFWGNITSAQTVFTNTGVTVGSLSFDNANSYMVTGQGSLTMDVSTGSALIEVKQGSHKINLPTFLNDNTTADVATGGELLISDPLTLAAGTTLTKTGDGLMTIEAPVRNAGPAALNVAGGTAVLGYPVGTAASAGAAASAHLSVSVAGSKVALTVNQTLAGLDAVTANAGDQQIELAGKQIRVYPADRVVEELQIYNDIKSAKLSASGQDGIYDSTAPVANYGIGVTDKAPDAHGDLSVLVRLTKLGDANVDGFVDISDLGALATSWQTAGLWDNGDFNYDNFIDISDLGALATNWQTGANGPSFDQALASVGLGSVSVPEPTSLALLGVATTLLAARRRRRD